MNNKEISILVVDDDIRTAKLLCTLLASRLTIDHNCAAASGTEEAKRLLESSFFHLVLTDIKMVNESGLDLCEHVHKNYWNTLVIVISGMTEIQYAIDAMRKGAFDYLLKPVNVAQLFESIERALSYQQVLMARYYCQQSLEEEVQDLKSLNEKLREAYHPPQEVKKLAAKTQNE
ncbi:MAG TPA: response regulator [Blastocatellia bacterium]|nr:response regulator [Blastocatellia bacterium]